MFSTTKHITMATRRAVYARDNFSCAICEDSRSVHLHHIIPRGKGGKDDERNLVCLCPLCHAIVHGEAKLTNQFPFDKDTAEDAIRFYMVYTYDDGG